MQGLDNKNRIEPINGMGEVPQPGKTEIPGDGVLGG
jgi:hypothetical protein